MDSTGSPDINYRLSGVFIHITEEGKMNSLLFAPQTKIKYDKPKLRDMSPSQKGDSDLFKAI